MGYDMTIQHDGDLKGDADYFRLNVFGMSCYGRLMHDLGMVHDSASPAQEEWPKWDEKLAEQDEAKAEFENERACKPLLTRHIGDNPTIPAHKFSSNDGWYVTAEECAAALAVYEQVKDDNQSRILEAVGDMDYWEKWIAYLKSAAEHEGFRVF